MASLTLSEIKDHMNRYEKEQLLFLGSDAIERAAQYLNLSDAQYSYANLEWAALVEEFLKTGKVSKQLRDYIQFYQIFVKTN